MTKPLEGTTLYLSVTLTRRKVPGLGFVLDHFSLHHKCEAYFTVTVLPSTFVIHSE